MDTDFLDDLFAAFGKIDIKRMFGGYGLSADSLNFGLVIEGQVYLKTDEDTRARFETEGCAPFSYEAKGRTMTLTSYWRMPERLYDDPDETAEWARAALGVARRAAAEKARPKKKVMKKITKGKVARRAAT